MISYFEKFTMLNDSPYFAPKVLPKTGAWCPFLDFRGCLGIRGTHTVATPTKYEGFVNGI